MIDKKPLDDAQQQLALEIEQARKVKSPHDLIDHVIKLYGAEFEKANDMLAMLQMNAKADAAALEELRLAATADAIMFEELRVTLTQQKAANDELFKIKQRVVIANRELMHKNVALEERDKARARVLTAAVAFCDAHKEDYEALSTSDSVDVDTSFMLLFQLVQDYAKTNSEHAQPVRPDDVRAEDQNTEAREESAGAHS
jgi:hypothetical protein